MTGGARGIGRAIGARLAAEGLSVVLVDRDAVAVRHTAAELGCEGRELDVCDAAAFVALVAELDQRGSTIDVLVNNAGIMSVGAFLELSPESDSRQLDINVGGVLNGIRAVLPGMLERKFGHVVNIASVAGRIGTPYVATYSATKFAVVGLTEALHNELRDTGVDFSYIAPALVRTELISGTGRPHFPPIARPEDVAAAVVDALVTGRVDRFVPRVSRLAAVLPVLLPRRLTERIGRLLGLDTMFAQVDRDARRAYVERSLSR